MRKMVKDNIIIHYLDLAKWGSESGVVGKSVTFGYKLKHVWGKTGVWGGSGNEPEVDVAPVGQDFASSLHGNILNVFLPPSVLKQN